LLRLHQQEIKMSELLTASQVSAYLRKKWGVQLNPNTLGVLSLAGRGPTLWNWLGCSSYQTADLDRWAQYYFPPEDCKKLEDHELTEVAAPTTKSGPTWLVVGEQGPDAEYVRDQFLAFGCNVLGPVYSPRRALELAATEAIEAAFLDMDWNVEAAITVAHVLTGRGIPYLFVTKLRDVPGTLAYGGLMLRVPATFDDIVFTIRSYMPRELTDRMDLSTRAGWSVGANDFEAAGA
jgi:hypothetical protein